MQQHPSDKVACGNYDPLLDLHFYSSSEIKPRLFPFPLIIQEGWQWELPRASGYRSALSLSCSSLLTQHSVKTPSFPASNEIMEIFRKLKEIKKWGSRITNP